MAVEHEVERVWRQRTYYHRITCTCGDWAAAAQDQIECYKLWTLHLMDTQHGFN